MSFAYKTAVWRHTQQSDTTCQFCSGRQGPQRVMAQAWPRSPDWLQGCMDAQLTIPRTDSHHDVAHAATYATMHRHARFPCHYRPHVPAACPVVAAVSNGPIQLPPGSGGRGNRCSVPVGQSQVPAGHEGPLPGRQAPLRPAHCCHRAAVMYPGICTSAAAAR